MTKRLFSLAMIMLTAITAWADETTITSGSAITFADNTSPQSGIYLHGTFGTDATHAASNSGTFDGTTIGWNLTDNKVLTGSASALPTIGNVTASGSGPDGTLAFNYSGSGTLHVVYGAAGTTDGKFYIMQKGSGDTSYTTAKEADLEGIAYTGILGTRSDASYTLVEATVQLSGSGTVYMGGTQPYCIYAILFEGATTVEEETTWTFENTTASTSITLNDKLYQRATTARYWTIETPTDGGTKSFSDGKSVTVSKVARSTTGAYLGSGGIPATTTAGGGNLGDATPFFAFDAEVPGTCYALVKSNGTGEIRIYSTDGSTLIGGTGKAATKSAELTEISLTSTTPGSFFIGGVTNNQQRDIYAIRFVPSTLYNITINSASNGSVVADLTKAPKDGTVTLTANPDASYQLASLSVKKANGEEITTTVDATDKNKYTFTMPEGDVTVTPTFSYVTPVTVTKGTNERTLSNGLIEVTINDNGKVTAIKDLKTNKVVMDASDASQNGYFNFNYRTSNSGSVSDSGLETTNSASITETWSSAGDMVEIVYPLDDSKSNSGQTWKLGYVMKSGVSGLYAYAILEGSSKYSELHEARIGWRVNPDMSIAWVNDDLTGTMPTPAQMKGASEVQDATYQIDANTIYTKYDWANFVKDDQLHGIMGDGYGAWLISPSTEWVNGGPMKQELTVHATDTTPIILQTLHSSHFGAQPGVYNGSEAKLFGPCLFYVNSGSESAMIADAKARASEEQDAWPYSWLNNSLLEKDSRSTVTGKINLSADFTKTTKIQVILSKAGKAPLLQGNGYQFYGETDSNGNFTIKNVRPGSYTLYAYALNGDATGMLEKTDVTVTAGATALGDIAWNPEKKGRTLWSIGEADHTTDGFSLSDSKRQYGLWNKVPSGDKTFTVGSSDESVFYYAQVANNETWSIKWNSDKAYDTPLYLTVALAGAAGGAKIEVKVNSNNAIQSIGTTSDNAIARSAVLAGADALYVVEIPAGQVVKGENTIYLKTWDISGVGGVMYDIIKLESTEAVFTQYGTFAFTGVGDANGIKPKWQDIEGEADMQLIPGDEFGSRFACGPKSQNSGNNCFKFRKSGSYDGLFSQYDNRTLSILSLKKGDMVMLTLIADKDGKTNLAFVDASQVGLSGTDVAVESGTTYIYNGADGGNLDFKTTGQVYLQKVVIQKPAAYAAPTFTVSGNKVTVTPPSAKGSETLKTYYKVNAANAQPDMDGTWTELPSSKVIEVQRSAYVFIYTVNAANEDEMSEVAKADVLLPVYDTYDFSAMAKEIYSANESKSVDWTGGNLTVNGTTISLNRAFSGTNINLRRSGNYFGLQASGAAPTMTIGRLSKGDWIKITHDGDEGFSFTSENQQLYGTTTTATTIATDAVYEITADGEVSLSIPNGKWIYAIQIANTSMAPTVSYKENKDGKAVYTISSIDGNKVQYKIGTGETVTPNAATAEVVVGEKCTLTAWTVSSSGNGAETVVELLSTPIVENNGIYNFSENLLLDGNLPLSLEDESSLTVGSTDYYKPGFAQAATFANQFLFEKAADMSKIMLRNKQLYIGKEAGQYSMVILNAPKGYKLSVTDGNKKVSKLYIDGQEWEYDKIFDVTETKNIVLKVDVTGGNASIQKIALSSPLDNVTISLSAEKSTNSSAIYVVSDFHSGQTLYYHRPQDAEGKFNTAAWKSDYDTAPMQITCTKNGDLIYYVVENGIQSSQTTIKVNSLITRPTATLKVLEDKKSIYKLAFQDGNTLYYTIPGGEEKTVSGGDSVLVDITKPGTLIAYAKAGEVTSDTLKTTVYVKTPSIVESDVYDFAKLKDVVGGDYTLNTRPSGQIVTAGGLILTKPDDVVENTLDRFGFASKRVDATNGRLYETDWRLLNAGRLRSSGTVADTMAIMNVKKGAYLLMTFSGKLNYMAESTAKLPEGTDELKSEQAYEVLEPGDLLIVNKSGTTSDITMISVTDVEVVTAPYFTEREKLNEVTLRLGKSNFGNPVAAYYTLDGSRPGTGGKRVDENTNISVDEDCTVRAVCISSTGVWSEEAKYEFDLPEASRSPKAFYDLKELVSKGDTLAFDTTKVAVKYMENNSGWEEKSRSDFYRATNLDGKISVRVGSSSLAYDKAEGLLQLKRAMAIHKLGVGDEIVIMYTGTGSLINVTSESGDEFTVNGETIGVAEEIPSGAKIVITKSKYEHNYIVVNASGDVYITAIYINSEAPDVVLRPQVELIDVETETATYLITYEEGARLYYELSTSEDGPVRGDTSGAESLTIDKSAKLKAWATRDGVTSDTLQTVIFAPTPAPVDNGDYDFAHPGSELPSDLEVTLDPNKKVKINGLTLYKPTAMTEQTFGGKFAFTETNTSGKIKIRTNRNLVFNRGANMNMALLNMSRGDIIAFDYTGTIQFADASAVSKDASQSALTRAAASAETMESGATYIVQKDGDVLLNLELTDVAVGISKMYVASAPKRSKAAAIDFATAGEEEEELLLDAGAAVWYGEKEAAVVFRRMANESDDMPVYGKVSTEGGNGALRTQGFKLDRRNIAIHNLAVGDTIKVRFSQGGIVYNGYAGKGDRVSVGGKLLEAGDSIRSGDVLKVESVDYLHNYVVLLYDARAIISGIFINTPEVEKILMPTITTKTNNTFVITGGISTTGNAVTTCYTVDGSEPTIFNGTSGPYESVEVQYIRAQQMTIKAFSYSETGAQSRVVTVLYDGVDLTPIEGVLADEPQAETDVIYDLTGRRVQNPQPGRLYIVDGKKRIYKR